MSEVLKSSNNNNRHNSSENNEKTEKTATGTSTPGPPQTSVDISRATAGVWLVKVPGYLSKKWKEASNDTEVGLVRITQTKTQLKSVKPEVEFFLNEKISQNIKPDGGEDGGPSVEQLPIEHKFAMTPMGTRQDVYILRQQPDELDAKKDQLAVIGRVIEQAVCTPNHSNSNYLQMKRDTNRKFNEPKKQIQMASDFMQKKHFLPKSTHFHSANSGNSNQFEKKDKVKRLRKDKEKVLDILFAAFNKHQYYGIKDLVKITQQPAAYLKDILHEICRYNAKGSHKNTWELKDEYKQGELGTTAGFSVDAKKKAAFDSIEKLKGVQTKVQPSADDFMDDADDLSDDDDDFDDDEMTDVV
jgi:transcription initiation factor TFIIF subunit beta